MTRKELCQILDEKILSCTKCDLHKTRKNAVPGEGNLNAEMIIVGEGPGQATGRPVVPGRQVSGPRHVRWRQAERAHDVGAVEPGDPHHRVRQAG